ncbi:MAG: 3-deoxy-D-manno-octulosonic acid transferase [Proteobacteria bacterium]|nr:3-deoxy-D-manno-octulosonic acid transferase [Pseudomonadota bacterium]
MRLILYTCVFYLAMPFVLLRLLKRSIREPGYRQDILHRFGFFRSANAGELIWIHAVSAGETVAVAPLVRRLVDHGYPCLVTNMTPTGRGRVRALLGDRAENAYAPYDLPGALGRFLRRNRPRLLVIVDTELWPNMLRLSAAAGTRVVVVNGRLSEHSAERYARVPAIIQPMIASIDVLAVQTQAHAERFVGLGASPGQLHVTGSIKFVGAFGSDHETRVEKARGMTAGRPVLLAASTHPGEESALLAILPSLQVVLPDALLVLAPRHTHRCDEVQRACIEAGFPVQRFSVLDQASDGSSVGDDDGVLLVDTMGELDPLFAIARLAFVGGSLVPVGGHNFLEAVRAGTAVIMGPHLDNIDDIARQFVDARAMLVVSDESQLRDEVIGCMPDEGRVRRLASAALAVFRDNQGSLDRTEEILLQQLGRVGRDL